MSNHQQTSALRANLTVADENTVSENRDALRAASSDCVALPLPSSALETEVSRRAKEQSHLMNSSLDSIEDFAYVFDMEGRFVYSNQALLNLLGIGLDEIVGKNFFDLNYPIDLATRLQHQIQKVFETRQVVRDETPFTGADGQSGIYEYVFVPVFNYERKMEFVAGTTRDVTNLRQAECDREGLILQLAAERAKLHYLFDKSPSFVAMLCGPQHVFELVNPAYQQLLGHRDLIGRPVREALPEVEGQGFFELLDHVFQSGETFTSRESAIQLQREPHGPLEERIVDFVYQPIFDAENQTVGIFAHGVDITSQVRARQEAEIANIAKDEFLATLSHELRTPLTAIVGWASILQSGQTTAEENALGLSTIARNARAQGQLIEDILDVSRMVVGKMQIELLPVHLQKMIDEALSAILPAAQSKNVRFGRVFEEEVSLVSGDAVRLQQILWNLLSNALKFTPEGGHVEVRLNRVASRVEIAVTDSGIGMTPEMLPHIFDRFRQANSSSTRSQGGLGLGLAIVQHLVELHGGSIAARSDGLGQGATFVVTLPLIAIELKEYSMPTSENKQSSATLLRGVHVLLVDDDEDTRSFLNVVLQKSGARVTSLSSAAEAFSEIQKLRPDVLLSDIGMPDEDGYSLIKRVRALPPNKGGKTPAAALTAHASDEHCTEILRLGFQAYRSKPVSHHDLVALIASLAKGDRAT